jgi:hypothetical protein
MATSEILGLFTTPEQYQQNQLAQFQNRAAKEVQLDPFQQAALGARTAGYQLGQGIGGALGGEDPQLKMISQRQQILGMIDPSNPDSYAQAIQMALQTGDTQTAFLLRNEMMKAKEKAQQQEIRGFEREKFLLDRGMGMQQRGMQANALELSKGLIKTDGTVDETVYNQLLGYGKIGTDIIEQRLKATQGLETVQVQNLAKKLFDKDGKRNPEVEKELSTTVAGRAILKQFIPETKVFKRGDIITEVNPVTGDYEIVTPTGLKQVPAGENPIKAMIDNKSIDKTVEPFAKEIAAQWDNLDDKGRADSLESLTKVNNTALDRNQRKAEAGVGGSNKVQSSTTTPDGTTILVMKDGTTKVISAQGVELTGQARADAIKASELFGAEIQGMRAQERGLGDLTAKQVNQAFAQIGKIKTNIGNIDEAIAAIDAGANTGVIASKLPNITAASVQLANIRNTLGLDVIGSVTFGALSEGELNLALDTALPTNLAPKDLRAYLVNKKTAQTKLAGYLTEQATYLSKKGNTLAGWLEKVENKATSGQSELPAGVTVKRKN